MKSKFYDLLKFCTLHSYLLSKRSASISDSFESPKKGKDLPPFQGEKYKRMHTHTNISCRDMSLMISILETVKTFWKLLWLRKVTQFLLPSIFSIVRETKIGREIKGREAEGRRGGKRRKRRKRIAFFP